MGKRMQKSHVNFVIGREVKNGQLENAKMDMEI